MVKMNIDTDTQWSRALAAHRLLVPPAPLLAPAGDRSYWDGIRAYYKKYEPYLNSQIGNPDGADKPNKKYYDPRMALRAAEEATVKRLGEAMDDLKCINVL